jgi:N-acetylneuraminic acid mutarotase
MNFLKAGLIAFASISLSPDVMAQPFVKKMDIIQFTNGRWGAMSFALNGKIYAGGGYVSGTSMNDWQEFDPAKNMWTPKTNYMPGPVANRAAGVTFVINGKAYLGLGAEHFLSFTLPVQQLSDLWSYDPATDKWTQHASLPDSGRNSSAVFVMNNKAYIVGGETDKTGAKTNDVWEYDPATDKWTSKGTFPGGAVRNAVAFSINGKGYVTGGTVESQSTPLKKLYEFNGSSWTSKADFPTDTARQGSVCFVVNNKAYVGLGGTFSSYPTTFFTYDPATDKWAFITDKWPAQGRMYGRAEVIGTKAYIGMGWRLDGGSTQTFFKDWYEVDGVGLLGIEDAHTNSRGVNLYPNPSTGIIHINTGSPINKDAYCNIYSIDGKSVGSQKLSTNNTIDLSNYAAGKYVLKLVSGDEVTPAVVEIIK